jgi:hypothetical protein
MRACVSQAAAHAAAWTCPHRSCKCAAGNSSDEGMFEPSSSARSSVDLPTPILQVRSQQDFQQQCQGHTSYLAGIIVTHCGNLHMQFLQCHRYHAPLHN